MSIAAAEERQLGAATGRSRRALEQEMARLGELNAHRHNYAELSRSMKYTSSAHWKDFQSFMDRLDRAVKSQQEIVRDSERNLEWHRHRWMAKRRRLESLQRVLESYSDDEVRHAQRLEQRDLDDLPAAVNMFEDDAVG